MECIAAAVTVSAEVYGFVDRMPETLGCITPFQPYGGVLVTQVTVDGGCYQVSLAAVVGDI